MTTLLTHRLSTDAEQLLLAVEALFPDDAERVRSWVGRRIANGDFAGDAVGQQFAAALSERARAGVQVHVLYDAVGSSDATWEIFDKMRAAGVDVIEYHPIRPWARKWGWWRRDHRKILVIDGETGF